MNKSKPLKRHTIRFSIPGEAVPILHDFMRRLGLYATESEFAESVVAYSLWCERMHHITGPSFRNRDTRRRMWEEVIADYGKPNKAGSFFEHRMAELAKEKTK